VTTGCLWFTFLNHRRGRSGNIVIGILIPRSGQPVRIERRRQRTADDPSKESPTRCAMKAIDNVYGQRAYNLLNRNTSARQGVLTRDSATSNPQFRSDGQTGSYRFELVSINARVLTEVSLVTET